jgi:hypothetical protein
METTFIPFVPLNTNANIVLDPTLSDADVRMILIAHCLRSEIQQAKTPGEIEKLTNEITASKFAAPRNKTRDHIRKYLNKMVKNPEVAKYLTFHLQRVQNNVEHKIILHFKDNMPDSISINSGSERPRPQEKKLQFHEEVIIANYLNQIKAVVPDFQFTPDGILEFCDTTPGELYKALPYLLTQVKTNNIRNAKGYLLKGFKDGFFIYNVVPKKYYPRDTHTKIEDNFEYEINLKIFNAFKERFLRKTENKNYRFYSRDNCSVTFLKNIRRAGKDLNVAKFLKRNDIPFEIVKDFVAMEGGGNESSL